MGYNVYVTGNVTVKPAVTDAELKRITAFDVNNVLSIEDRGEEDRVELIAGEITVIEGARYSVIGCVWDDLVRDTEPLFNALQQVADTLRARKSVDTTVEDHFILYGEESGDISRFVILAESDVWMAKHQRPKLLWPDGTTSEP